MYELTTKNQAAIDEQLQGKLEWAENNKLQAEQLALDATRLLSCTTERFETYRNQGFFKRCWYSLSGENDEMQKANQRDLVSMQQYSWRYISLLNERNILLAHSMITVKNNLLTLAVAEEETRNEVRRMAEKVYERFIALEDRMKAVEVATNIHGWLITLDTLDYDDRFTPHFRLLRLVNDFIMLKPGNWNPQELRYLQKAVKEADLPWKEAISVESFIDGVIDEIESAGYNSFECLLGNKIGVAVPASFILENVAVPTYTSLFSIADNYTKSSNTIDVLIEQLSCTRIEAIKKVLMTFIARQGVDISAKVPLRDLAIELLSCMRLGRDLFSAESSPVQSKPARVAAIAPQPSAEIEALASEARLLVPQWIPYTVLGISSTVVEKVWDMIEKYVENEGMEISEIAAYFSAEDIAEELQEGIDNAVRDTLQPMVDELQDGCKTSTVGVTVVDGFRRLATEAMKPYLECVVAVEVSGATMTGKQPSMVGRTAKGIGVGAVAGTLLGPVGIIGVIAANYLHDKSKDTSFESTAEEFDACVQQSFEAYDEMVEAIGHSTQELLEPLFLEAIDRFEAEANADDLTKSIQGMKALLAEAAANDDDVTALSESTIEMDQNQLLAALKEFKSDDYYVKGSIPPEKLAAAQNYPVSPGYDVLALVDATLFGSAKIGMAITQEGVFWSNGNGWLDTTTERNHLTWTELMDTEKGVSTNEHHLILIPGSLINLAGSSVEPKELRRLLKKCLKLMG